MLNLIYTHKLIPLDQKQALVVTLDSCREWDAEQSGNESGYDLFLQFMGELIVRLRSDGALLASFVRHDYRRGDKTIGEKAKLRLIRYPKYEPEQLLRVILQLFGMKYKKGSGVSFVLNSGKDVEAICRSHKVLNDWLFFYIGSGQGPRWSCYRPFYLMEMDHDYEALGKVIDSWCIVYHETGLCYLEIQSVGLTPSAVLSSVHSLVNKYGISLEVREPRD